MGYKWREVQKGVFFDEHEREDVVEYRETFLSVEFSDNGSILPKVYPDDCAVGGSNRRPIIMITHDESTFSANDGRQKVWTLEGHGILRPKGKGKGIMVSDFLLPWSRLNRLSLPPQQQEELVSLGIPLEAVSFAHFFNKTSADYVIEHVTSCLFNHVKHLPL